MGDDKGEICNISEQTKDVLAQFVKSPCNEWDSIFLESWERDMWNVGSNWTCKTDYKNTYQYYGIHPPSKIKDLVFVFWKQEAKSSECGYVMEKMEVSRKCSGTSNNNVQWGSFVCTCLQ